MSEYNKMISGELYDSSDEELGALSFKQRGLMSRYNQLPYEAIDERREMLKDLFGSIGECATVQAPVRIDYGVNVHIGDNFYANYDSIFLDVAPIEFGDNVMFAPRVGLYTATHPIDPGVRNRGLEYAKPIKIGSNSWLGANTTVLPDVTIGENVVIGGGSVVTNDIPDNVVAYGNPCRVIRPIDENDKKYWEDLETKYYEEK